MQRLKAYSIFANTKDKRLIQFFKEPQSLNGIEKFQGPLIKNLSLEHFIYVLHKFHDLQFLKEILEIINNTIEFHSRYSIQKDYGKIIMDYGYKTDYSLGGRINIVLKKIKKILENYE